MILQEPRGVLAISLFAIVVTDLRTTMEPYHRTLGWGPWSAYEFGPPWLHDTAHPRG